MQHFSNWPNVTCAVALKFCLPSSQWLSRLFVFFFFHGSLMRNWRCLQMPVSWAAMLNNSYFFCCTSPTIPSQRSCIQSVWAVSSDVTPSNFTVLCYLCKTNQEQTQNFTVTKTPQLKIPKLWRESTSGWGRRLEFLCAFLNQIDDTLLLKKLSSEKNHSWEKNSPVSVTQLHILF